MLMRTLVLFMLVAQLFAQEPLRPWTPEDFSGLVTVEGAELSADGRLALFEISRPDVKQDLRRTSLHLSRDAEEPRQILFSHESCGGGHIAPDGSAISFLSQRMPAAGQGPEDAEDADTDEERPDQLWLLRLDGGEPRCLSSFPLGVSRAEWAGPRALLVVARERRSAREVEEKEAQDESVVVEGASEWAAASEHVFRIELDADFVVSKIRRLTDQPGRIAGLEVAPDGSRAVLVRITSPQHEVDERDPPVVTLLDTSTGAELTLFAERKNRPLEFSWQPDSRAFFALMPRSTEDGASTAAVLDLVRWQDRKVEALDLGWEAGAQPGSLAALNDGCLVILMRGCVPRPVRVRHGLATALVEDLGAEVPGHIHHWVRARDASRVMFVEGTAMQPDRWHVAELGASTLSAARLVFEPHSELTQRRFADARVIQWIGAAKEGVEGILFSPPDAGTKPLPLIVMPHGGPFALDYDRFEEGYAYAPQLYCQRGARVLYVNYHGSSGYGLAFGESIRGRNYELELEDILAGVEALVQDGLVDANALAVGGWSNGAILATALVSMADVFAPRFHLRFKACIDGAGDVNWTSDYGNCAFGPVFDDFYMGGPPWKRAADYIRKSPLFHVEKVTTPTLIFFGTEDTSVPTEQGHEWHRALQQLGKAPVRFILFPGEEHGLRKPNSQLRKLREEMVWMERHFFGAAVDSPPLAKGSPLELLLAQQGRASSVLGLPMQGVLAPETVSYEGLAVGVHEVTLAQWQSVFPDRQIPPGRENWPVTGITEEEAMEYAARLTQRTGTAWRLLTLDEQEALPRGPDENNLAWWAGFEPAPAEARALRERIEALPERGAPPLLEAAGSRRGGVFHTASKPALIHDAGGNAQEWCLAADGGTCLAGASAVTVLDITGQAEIAPLRWTGLRVAMAGPPAQPR